MKQFLNIYIILLIQRLLTKYNDNLVELESKLKGIGYNIGVRIIEKKSQDIIYTNNKLDVIKYICIF